jgi:hypothetical protein
MAANTREGNPHPRLHLTLKRNPADCHSFFNPDAKWPLFFAPEIKRYLFRPVILLAVLILFCVQNDNLIHVGLDFSPAPMRG